MEPLHVPTPESEVGPPANPASVAIPLYPRLLRAVRLAGFTLVSVVLIGLGYEATLLWRELNGLRQEWHDDARTRVIGFTEVTPHFSFALPPKDWFHEEDDHQVLWAGWNRERQEHEWFHLQPGSLDPSRLSHSIGRDVVRAIDLPKVETGEGQVWQTLPEDHLVAAAHIQGVALAYPFGVLDKVLIVNDAIPEAALLVVFAPFRSREDSVSLFNPVLNSERLTMGHTGYLFDGEPLLYDRKTESLWVASSEGLAAVAGPLRGSVLARVSQVEAVEWGTWRSSHPDTRLVIGSVPVGPLARN